MASHCKTCNATLPTALELWRLLGLLPAGTTDAELATQEAQARRIRLSANPDTCLACQLSEAA